MRNIQIALWDESWAGDPPSSKNRIAHQWQFVPPASIGIGRSPEHQVVIDHPSVSRLHGTIAYINSPQGGGYWQLTNLGSNGTLVNDIPIARVLLTSGDRIQLAPGVILTIQLDVAPAAPTCTHPDNPANTLFCVHCGEPIRIERQIRNYQILKTLGQGGMGTTYLAWDRTQVLVLKEMNADMEAIPKAQELFAREAKILQSLNHTGIPKYYDFFVENRRKYLAMELIHGQDLEQYIIMGGKVGFNLAIDWMVELCGILGYIHQQQPPLIHRDIKPANLLVRTVDRRIFLLDFGAVKEIGTPGGTRIGAPDYMAPEQNSGQPCTQSDLYAIGPTLIFLLTGRNPADFVELDLEGFRFNVSSIPSITPGLRAIIDRVTNRRPRDRYKTAAELAQALESQKQ
jgi:serine/threonine protein kinase, bacterial